MAVELYDDHEQGERVKQWIKTNGGGILLGVALAMGGLFGYRYWQDQQQQQGFNAAQHFQVVSDQLTVLAANTQTQVDNVQSADDADIASDAEMLEALATLQNDYPDNLYSALATLQVADQKLGGDDLEGAIQQYSFILDNSSNAEIRSIAVIRLARAQLAMQQPEASLQTLNGLPADSAHTSLSARIRGEAYLAMNDRAQALQAFEQAEQELGGTPDRMLELRLADLRDVDIDALREGAEPVQAPPIFSNNTTVSDGEPVSLVVGAPDDDQSQSDVVTEEPTDTDGDQ